MENIYRRQNKDMKQFHIAVGRRLRLLRKTRKFTQEKLAEAMNVTFQQIQKYEKELNGLSLYRTIQVADILGVDVPYFTNAIDKDVEVLTKYEKLQNNDHV